MDKALAAGQGGSKTVPAPQSQDEVHRQSAVEALAAHLAKGEALLARCEAMANAARGDRLSPIYAAARLMNANAQIAKALAHVALVESRHRTFVETIQPSGPKNPQLNSRFFSVEKEEDIRATLERRLDRILKASGREEERKEGLAAASCT